MIRHLQNLIQDVYKRQAKGIAHGTANPDTKLWDIWTGQAPLTKSLPVGVVLTIPAAGSEMSDSAVLTNEEIGRKAGINTPFNRVKFAIMNPELTYTLPRYQVTCGIVDIMMHTLDRYFTHTTVSYTHLDVYKRQVSRSPVSISARGLSSF